MAENEDREWLTETERCDQCGAQSYYMVSFEYGTLFFCHHHYKENEDKLFETAVDIVDESELLN
jgi:hypothetical protein